jgi:hypothetical protein
MAEFASKGVAGTGLGLGIAGTALGVLAGGLNNLGMGGLFGNGYNHSVCNGSDNQLVNRYEQGLIQENAILRSDKKLLESTVYTDQKLLEVYKYFDGELKDIRQHQCDKWAAQGVINAKFESGLDVMASQIASINGTIGSITKTVIPNANVCPGWGAVYVQPTGCGCVNGYNSNI